MSYTGTTIKNKVQLILEDDGTRWSDATLLDFINDGIRAIVVLKPDSSVSFTILNLSAGAEQTISGYLLFDVLYNCNSSGTVIGQAPLRINRATLDYSNPTWMQTTQESTVKFFTYSPEDGKNFYVYPPSDGTNYLRIKESTFPADLATLAGTIALGTEFIDPLIMYVCYKAFLQDTDTANNAKAMAFYEMFVKQIGALTQTDAQQEQRNAS